MTMAAALYWRRERLLLGGFWLLLLLVLAEVAGVLLLCYWAYALGAIPAERLNQLFGKETRGSIDSALAQLLDEPVAVAEGSVCMVYRTCCFDPRIALITRADDAADTTGDAGSGLDGGGALASGDLSGSGYAPILAPPTDNTTTCLKPAAHHGATTDLEFSMRDPSAPNFCSYTSGASHRMLSAPPQATCSLVERLATDDGFSLDRCRRDFCEARRRRLEQARPSHVCARAHARSRSPRARRPRACRRRAPTATSSSSASSCGCCR